MGLIKLGSLIERVDRRNGDLRYGDGDVRGVSNSKEIMPTRADIKGRSLKKFYVVFQGEFVFNRRTTRMGERIGLGYNDTDRVLLFTEDYVAFRVSESGQSLLLADYLNLFFRRDEFDRYVRYDSWGSATEFFNWEEMCEVSINLPPLEIQQKYVDVYKAMKANQEAYERGLDDIKTVIDSNLDKLKRSANRVTVGTLLDEVDVRNRNGDMSDVRGINIEKEFIYSVANLTSTDLTKYKVIKDNQFAYSAMQTGRDECIRIALYQESAHAIISPAYSVLKTKTNNVLSEYIMLWFSRSESDRYGWFISDSSIRASLELKRFYEIEIPLPNMSQQKALVNLYRVFLMRKNNASRLRGMLKDICPILIKGSTEDAKNPHAE